MSNYLIDDRKMNSFDWSLVAFLDDYVLNMYGNFENEALPSNAESHLDSIRLHWDSYRSFEFMFEPLADFIAVTCRESPWNVINIDEKEQHICSVLPWIFGEFHKTPFEMMVYELTKLHLTDSSVVLDMLRQMQRANETTTTTNGCCIRCSSCYVVGNKIFVDLFHFSKRHVPIFGLCFLFERKLWHLQIQGAL